MAVLVGGEELGRGLVAEGLMWSGVIVLVLPGAQGVGERRQRQIPGITLPELVTRGAVGALDH